VRGAAATLNFIEYAFGSGGYPLGGQYGYGISGQSVSDPDGHL